MTAMTYYGGAKPIKLNLEGKEKLTREDGVIAYRLAKGEESDLFCTRWANGDFQNIVLLRHAYVEEKYKNG